VVHDLVRRQSGSGSRAIWFIHFSGHGTAEKHANINYFIPVDAKEPGTAFCESVKLEHGTAPLGRCMYLTEQTPAAKSRSVRAIGWAEVLPSFASS
jgi:hypothetical protein